MPLMEGTHRNISPSDANQLHLIFLLCAGVSVQNGNYIGHKSEKQCGRMEVGRNDQSLDEIKKSNETLNGL